MFERIKNKCHCSGGFFFSAVCFIIFWLIERKEKQTIWTHRNVHSAIAEKLAEEAVSLWRLIVWWKQRYESQIGSLHVSWPFDLTRKFQGAKNLNQSPIKMNSIQSNSFALQFGTKSIKPSALPYGFSFTEFHYLISNWTPNGQFWCMACRDHQKIYVIWCSPFFFGFAIKILNWFCYAR